MRSIREIKNKDNKTILLRAGFDVPIKNGKVTDSRRIKILIPTIQYLLKKGPLIVLSHQGRPNGKKDMSFSQRPLVPVLEKFLKMKVKFADSCIGPETEKVAKSLKKGEILLLENLRFEKGEEGNNLNFAKKLAKLGGIYVIDAFTNAHRKHASMIGVPKYLPTFIGFQFLEEIKYLSLVSKKEKHPFLLILGGAKFETKIPIIKRFLNKSDTVFMGGALATQILKEEGCETGLSLSDVKNYNLPSIVKNSKILLPKDFVVINKNKKRRVFFDNLSKDDYIVDIGLQTIKDLEKKIRKAKTILWNGPLGKTSSGFDVSTKEIVRAIAKTESMSVVGGGDTVEIISKLKMENKFTFVSTGGGATLDFLAYGTLPVIEALK